MYRVLFVPFLFCLSFSAQYRQLSKKDIKAFRKSFKAVEIAFNKNDFSGVILFGPGVLNQYSPVLIQPDKYAFKALPFYKRLDSMVAYSVYRTKLDSIGKLLEGRPVSNQLISEYDKILNALGEIPVLSKYKEEWVNTQKSALTSRLDSLIKWRISELRNSGGLNLEYDFFSKLRYQPEWLKPELSQMHEQIEDAFYSTRSSNKIKRLKEFKDKYPNQFAREVSERISLLQGDMIRTLLSRGGKDELLSFYNDNPGSPYIREVLSRLEPILYQEAITLSTEDACRLYLSKFNGDNERSLRVRGILRAYQSIGYGEVNGGYAGHSDYHSDEAEPMYRLPSSDFKDQYFEDGVKYRVRPDNNIPDAAIKKMMELGLIQPEKGN